MDVNEQEKLGRRSLTVGSAALLATDVGAVPADSASATWGARAGPPPEVTRARTDCPIGTRSAFVPSTRAANSSSGGRHIRTSTPSSTRCAARATIGSTSPRDPNDCSRHHVFRLDRAREIGSHPAYEPLGRPGKPFPSDADIPTMWRVDAEKADQLYAAALNRRRAEIGLPPVTNVRDHIMTRHPWLATDPFLDPRKRTPGIDPVQTGAWFRPDRRPLPPALMAFLDGGTPPVYVGFGSRPMHAAPEVAPAVLNELRARGRRVVVHRGWAGLAPVDEQDTGFVVDDVNHQALFPRVGAVVHHGGAGTTTVAARAGTPQLVVPQLADQPYWGARVAELGIGATATTVASLPAALSSTLRVRPALEQPRSPDPSAPTAPVWPPACSWP